MAAVVVLLPGCFLFLDAVVGVGLAAKVEVPGIESRGTCELAGVGFC